MKILGIVGSARKSETSGVHTLVQTVLDHKGAASCFSCGFGETCKVGIPVFLHGPGVKITEGMIPDVAKQPQAMQAAAEAGKLLGKRLREGHDRGRVTQNMQQRLMAMFAHSA